MDMALNMGAFEALDQQEMMEVDGGSREAAACVLIVGGAVIAGVLAPLTCGGSVAVYAEGVAAGCGVMLAGVQVACGG